MWRLLPNENLTSVCKAYLNPIIKWEACFPMVSLLPDGKRTPTGLFPPHQAQGSIHPIWNFLPNEKIKYLSFPLRSKLPICREVSFHWEVSFTVGCKPDGGMEAIWQMGSFLMEYGCYSMGNKFATRTSIFHWLGSFEQDLDAIKGIKWWRCFTLQWKQPTGKEICQYTPVFIKHQLVGRKFPMIKRSYPVTVSHWTKSCQMGIGMYPVNGNA